MRQTGTETVETTAAPGTVKANRGKAAPSLKEALIVVGGAGIVGLLIGLIPHFGGR